MRKRIRILSLLLIAAVMLGLLSGCKPKRAKEIEATTLGIDVARYQGTIDWQQVADSGVEFAMIRIGYRSQKDGMIKLDPNARYNLQEAQRCGVKMGAYFFSTAISSKEIQEEVDWVKQMLAPYAITYPVAFDCEGFSDPESRQHTLSKAERTDLALEFLEGIRKAGYEPMFYASKNDMLEDARWETSRIEEDYKIWLAWYPYQPYPETRQAEYPGVHQMWQYTQEGSVPGIDAPVDRNVCYFGYDGISEPMSDEPVEIAYPDPEAMLNFEEVHEEVTAKIEVNLRSEPSEEKGAVLNMLKNGDIALRTGICPSGWSRVEYSGNIYYAASRMLTTDMDYDPSDDIPEPVDTDGDGLLTEFTPVNETVTAKEEVNLRTLPSTEHPDCEVVYLLKNGETVRRTGIDEKWGWSRVEYMGETCYAISSMLTTDVSGATKDVSEVEQINVTMAFNETYDAVTARIKVNLRNIPSTEDPRSQIVYELKNGEVAVRTGVAAKGEWARVQYKGQTLYCINNYLELTK